jgi:hypothetical protein
MKDAEVYQKNNKDYRIPSLPIAIIVINEHLKHQFVVIKEITETTFKQHGNHENDIHVDDVKYHGNDVNDITETTHITPRRQC